MPFPAAHRSRPATLLSLLALVTLLVAGCSGSSGSGKSGGSAGARSGGTVGGSGVPANNDVSRGAHVPLPHGLPTPSGKQAANSVATRYGGTWNFTGTKQSDLENYAQRLVKDGWLCKPTTSQLATFGYTCTKSKVPGSVQMYYLPKKKTVAVTYNA